RALGEYEIEHLKTLIPFHQALLATDQWGNAETCRDLVEDKAWLKELAFPPPVLLDDDGEEKVEQAYTVEVSGRKFDVKVIGPPPVGGVVVSGNGAAPAGGAASPKKRGERKSSGGGGADELVSPLQGNMWKVLVKQGDT